MSIGKDCYLFAFAPRVLSFAPSRMTCFTNGAAIFFMECGCAGGFEVSGGALETARGARALPGVNLVNLVRILRTLFAHASLSVDRAVSLRGCKKGVMRNECLGILRSFFSMRRAEAKTHPVANREISELDDQNEMPS